MWKVKLAEMKGLSATSNAAATTIAKSWRGYIGKDEASRLRKLLEDYIATIQEEGKREEEELRLAYQFAKKWRYENSMTRQLWNN